MGNNEFLSYLKKHDSSQTQLQNEIAAQKGDSYITYRITFLLDMK
ncbi:hypothetical protein Q9306_22625 [Bacillus sp. WLY-B-L8]|nr:hypothetical protein [Bacillus sp. WLY-B-L8]